MCEISINSARRFALKSNLIKAVAAVFIFISLVFMPVSGSFAEDVPDTLRTFGENMVTVIRAKNRDGFLAIVHPEVLEYMNKNDKERLDLIVTDLIQTEIPKNAEFVVQTIEEEPAYDKTTQSLKFKDGRMYFPVAPSLFLYLVVPVEVAKQENGVEKKTTVRKPIMANAVRNDNGKYYVVFPVIVMDDSSKPLSGEDQSGK